MLEFRHLNEDGESLFAELRQDYVSSLLSAQTETWAGVDQAALSNLAAKSAQVWRRLTARAADDSQHPSVGVVTVLIL